MSKILLSGLAALAVTTPAAALASTVIDFSAAPGSFTSYTVSGVTFTPTGAGPIQRVQTPNGTDGLLAVDSPRSTIRASIAGGTSFVSVDLGDFNSDPDLLFLDAYDASNNLLGHTQLLIDASFIGMETLSLSLAGIDHVVFGSTTPSLNGSSVFADNFTFNGAAVPEPAAWALMIAGFAMIGGAARRRTRALAA